MHPEQLTDEDKPKKKGKKEEEGSNACNNGSR